MKYTYICIFINIYIIYVLLCTSLLIFHFLNEFTFTTTSPPPQWRLNSLSPSMVKHYRSPIDKFRKSSQVSTATYCTLTTLESQSKHQHNLIYFITYSRIPGTTLIMYDTVILNRLHNEEHYLIIKWRSETKMVSRNWRKKRYRLYLSKDKVILWLT